GWFKMTNVKNKQQRALDLQKKAVKLHVRTLLNQREALSKIPNQQVINGDEWLDEMVKIGEKLLEIYIKYLATDEWVYAQLTEQAPHCLLDVEGEQAMFEELRQWANS